MGLAIVGRDLGKMPFLWFNVHIHPQRDFSNLWESPFWGKWYCVVARLSASTTLIPL